MTYEQLHQSVESAAGFRLRLILQPLGGEGETIFPPTVAGGKYLISPRRVPGFNDSVSCAIVDSVQSQANRLEDALIEDILAGNLFLPHVITDFTDVDLIKPVGRDNKLTCFDAPHRIFDAILRDSLLGGKHFPLSDLGKKVIGSSSQNATAIFSVSPASLLFGSWDSTGVSGGLGEKYARCVVSELVGINIAEALRGGTRIDPLNSEKNQKPDSILNATKDELWKDLKKSRKKFDKPSEINHSSVPWGGDEKNHGGITCDYVRQTTTISLAAIRQLRFPVQGKETKETSSAAQAVLAAIALHAATLNTARGWHLRSRCDLIPAEGELPAWETIGTTSIKSSGLDVEASRTLLKEAVSAALATGLPWHDEPIKLTPSPALQALVKASQEAHRSSTEGEAI